MRTFADTIKNFLGVPFKEGGTSPDGYDCLGAVARICQKRDLNFPEEFGKWNIENYRELYKNGSKEYVPVMIDFFDSFAKRVNVNRIVTGDLLLIRQIDDTKFPAIYTGSRNAITSFIRTGVSVFHLDDFNRADMAWRI